MKVAYTFDDKNKTLELSPSTDGWELKFNYKGEFHPLYNNVIVEKDEEKEQTKGGIILPDDAKDKPSTGIVVAVGTGNYNELTGQLTPLTVKAGDRVLFAKFAGTEVEIDDKSIFILKEKDILSIIE